MAHVETRILTLAKVNGLEPTKINLWKVAFEELNNLRTTLENKSYKSEEEIRSVKNEIYRIYKSEEEIRSVKNEIYRIYKSEEEICIVKNEIYQVVGFFSAFQGLLITAAAQWNLLRCNNAGLVLALFAFATAVAVFGIVQKDIVVTDLRRGKSYDKRGMEGLARWLGLLQWKGTHFDFGDFFHESEFINNSCLQWKEILVSYGIWLVESVIAFAGLCMLAMHQILCNPGQSLPSN